MRYRCAIPSSKSRGQPVRGPTFFHLVKPSPHGGCFADIGVLAARIVTHHRHTPPFEIPSNPAKPEPNPTEDNNRQHTMAFHDMRLTNYSNEPRAGLSFGSQRKLDTSHIIACKCFPNLMGLLRKLNLGPFTP